MKDIDQQQHLDLRNKERYFIMKTFDLPVSEIAETDALGGCCSK
jgi:hypothetical protein